MSGNTVFISYRRSVSAIWARAVAQHLRDHQIESFYYTGHADVRQIEPAVLQQIAACPYFVLILTPGTLKNCHYPGVLVMREIEEAVRLKRAIIRLQTPEFDEDDIDKYLPTHLAEQFKAYPTFEIPYLAFPTAMQAICTHLTPIDVPTTPTSEAMNVQENQSPVTAVQLAAQGYFERAWKKDDTKDYAGAVSNCSEAIRLYPDFAEAYTGRASAYFHQQTYTGMMADCEEAVRLDPHSDEARSNLGLARLHQRDFAGAIADCTHAIEMNSLLAEAYVNRSLTYLSTYDLEQALTDCTQAIYLNPLSAYGYNARGCVRLLQKEYTASLADFSHAISLDPQLAVFYYNRGLARFHQRDYQGAVEDHTQAIQLDPQLVMAYLERGVLREDKADFEEALAQATQGVQRNPFDANAYELRGCTRYFSGNYRGAVDDLTRAIEIDPTFADAYIWRARAYIKLKKMRKMMADYWHVLVNHPNHPRADEIRTFVMEYRDTPGCWFGGKFIRITW
ncbi:MAG: tetratricopeptide repeat protein [Anaerolineae bacterium]|nr:tetratricopeptide repeat protein [Anaerolineae bacterium]